MLIALCIITNTVFLPTTFNRTGGSREAEGFYKILEVKCGSSV
jgi:hypothetical protein